jgi:hypothetical protein
MIAAGSRLSSSCGRQPPKFSRPRKLPASFGDELTQIGVVSRVAAVVGGAYQAILAHDKRTGEKSCIAGGRALHVALDGGAQRGGNHLGPSQLRQPARPQAVSLMRAGAAAYQAGEIRSQRRAITLGVLGLAEAHGQGAQPGGFDLGVMLL